MSYLEAHPGIRQKIGDKIFTIKRMYSQKKDAERCVAKCKAMGKFREVVLYPRRVNGKLFGRHPFCVAVRGRIRS